MSLFVYFVVRPRELMARTTWPSLYIRARLVSFSAFVHSCPRYRTSSC